MLWANTEAKLRPTYVPEVGSLLSSIDQTTCSKSRETIPTEEKQNNKQITSTPTSKVWGSYQYMSQEVLENELLPYSV